MTTVIVAELDRARETLDNSLNQEVEELKQFQNLAFFTAHFRVTSSLISQLPPENHIPSK